MKPIYLIDGYSVIYRNYFAFMKRPLTNPAGENVSALYGFFRFFLNLLHREQPGKVVVLLDSRQPTFRHEKYPEYKQNRQQAPEDLHTQVDWVEKILECIGSPPLRCDGFEADDLIASLVKKAEVKGIPCRVITGDKDLLQLVTEDTLILRPEKGNLLLVDGEGVLEERGVRPDQIGDYLALTGDASDNIPGVKGIGVKSAAKLLNEYDTLDNLYNSIEEISASGTRRKLEEGKESAFFSRELVALRFDAPVPDVETLPKVSSLTLHTGASMMRSYGVPSLANEMRGEGLFAYDDDEEEKEQIKGDYKAILDEASLKEWAENIRNNGICAFDSETDSLDDLLANPVGFSFSFREGEGCYIPLLAQGVDCLSAETVKKHLRPILEDPSIKIIGHNLKYDYKILYRWGIAIANPYFDTMIAAWMLDSESPVGMDRLAPRYLGTETRHFKDVVPKGMTFDKAPFQDAVIYAAEDADVTLRFYNLFSEKLAERGIDRLFHNVEMPLLHLLAQMELRGICLDVKMLNDFGKELKGELSEIESSIYSLVGKEFNVNSTKQLQEVLFTDLGLTPVKKTKTGYSTDTSVLEELAAGNPVPEKILRHRTLSKLRSTYVEALPKMLHEETNRVHTHFNQVGTTTGRLSSQDPNLQNIPVREAIGRRIRRAFKPTSGNIFLSADYSQIELVILAHLSEDPGLTTAFQSGKDIHRRTAAQLMGVNEENVDDSMRRIAKSINFGVIYGMSAFRLARELHLYRREAERFIESYFSEFSGVKDYIDRVVDEVRRDGVVRTLMGHERPIPGINSRNKTEAAAARRVAVNTSIQGSAADVVKRAMLDLDNGLREKGFGSKMLLQVHDEIIFEVPMEEKETIAPFVKEVMEGTVDLSVPLRIDLAWGESWGEAK